MIQGVNVLVQQICKKKINGKTYFSMSSDPDTHLEAGQIMRKEMEKGKKKGYWLPRPIKRHLLCTERLLWMRTFTTL